MLPNHDQIRQTFPGLKDKVFLDAACVSLASQPTCAAVQRFLNDAMLCPEPSASDQHIAMDVAREEVRGQAARLVNATEREIAIVESTSVGLNLAAWGIPFQPGDNVVLCDLEYLQVAIPFDALRQHKGIEIRQVHHRNGVVTPDDFRRACDSRTRAIVVSSVQWSSGLLIDLAALAEIAARHKAWLVVDAIQQLGAAPIDVARTGVDFLACGGHKWLNAPFGTGFLYLREERLNEVEPLQRGYLTLEDPEGGWGTYFRTPSITPFREYRYVESAKKLEAGGTANYPGGIGLAASLKQIHALGQDAIQGHIAELTAALIEGLQQRDLRVITPLDPAQRAGIVTFRCFEEAERETEVAAFLASHHIYCSTRFTSGVGGTRISSHFFNNRADIDQLLATLDAFLNTSA